MTGNLVVGDGALGNIYARATTAAIGTATTSGSQQGAMQVFGGLGVQGNIVVGQDDSPSSGNVYIHSQAEARAYNQGALVISGKGGIGVGGNVNIRGNLTTQGGFKDRSANVVVATNAGNTIVDWRRYTTIFAPAASIGSHTIWLPTVDDTDQSDGISLRVAFGDTITTITMGANAGISGVTPTIKGGLTTASAGTNAEYLFVASQNTWFRVG